MTRDKKGGSLLQYLIAILIFSLVVSGFGIIYVDLGTNYNITTNETNRTAYDRLSQTQALTASITENVTKSEVQDTNSLFTLTLQGFKALRLIPQSVSNVEAVSTTAAQEIGIPAIFLAAFIAILLLFIVFKIVSAILRWDV